MAEKKRNGGNPPAFIARARQSAESDFMSTIGAAFPFKEGEGYVVNLQFLPTARSENGNLSFILVPPKED